MSAKHEQFCMWLQGFADAIHGDTPSLDQWVTVCKALSKANEQLTSGNTASKTPADQLGQNTGNEAEDWLEMMRKKKFERSDQQPWLGPRPLYADTYISEGTKYMPNAAMACAGQQCTQGKESA